MGLLDLPNELLFAISEEVKNLPYRDALSTLYEFAFTNPLLWQMVEPSLYLLDMENYKSRALKWGVVNDAIEIVTKSLVTRTWPRGHPILDKLLLEAAEMGSVAIVKLLLDHNADINYRIYPYSRLSAEGSRNALTCAVENENTDVVELLLEYDKQDIDLRDPEEIFNRFSDQSSSPLFIAAAHQYVEILKLLVHKGALFLGGSDVPDPIADVVEDGDLEVLAALLGEVHPEDRAYKHKKVISLPATRLLEPLEKALSYRKFEVVILLLQHGAKFNDRNIPGDVYVREFCRFMLGKGLKNGLPLDMPEPVGTTLWYCAVEDKKKFQLLLDHPQGQEIFRKNYPVLLERALNFDSTHDLNFLLRQGREWHTPRDLFLAFYMAVFRSDYNSASRLLSCGAPVNVPPGFSFPPQVRTRFRGWAIRQPLWIAVDKGNLRLVKRLLEHGADPNEVVFPTGNHQKRHYTVLRLAIRRKDEDIAEVLCDYGATAPPTTSYGKSGIMRIIQGGSVKLAEKHLSQMTREQIQEKGFLQVATGMGNAPMVKLLLDNGVSATTKLRLDHRNTRSPINGMLMADYAEYKGHTEIARMLREYESTAS